MVPPGLKSMGTIEEANCHPHFKSLFKFLEEREVSLG